MRFAPPKDLDEYAYMKTRSEQILNARIYRIHTSAHHVQLVVWLTAANGNEPELRYYGGGIGPDVPEDV